jgi:hypothetical protein
MGASILPITIHNNKIMFLFGKERNTDDNPGWSDFGGGTDNGESFMQTAIREGGEELTGFLGNDSDITSLLKKYGTYNIDYNSEKHSTYRVHIFPMVYDSQLPLYYNNNQQFLQKRLDKNTINNTKIFEKTRIQWFTFSDIKKKRHNFRVFYRQIIELILVNKTDIEHFIYKSFAKNKQIKCNNIKTHTNKYNRINNHNNNTRKI